MKAAEGMRSFFGSARAISCGSGSISLLPKRIVVNLINSLKINN